MTGTLRHRWAAWTAALALLWAALAPAFADQVRSPSPREMLQVCSVMGMMMVPIDDAPSSDTGALPGAGHCPWCSLQAHTPGVPVAQATALAVVPVRHARPLPPPQGDTARREVTHTWSRGPPARG